jgi:hypothetical protein
MARRGLLTVGMLPAGARCGAEPCVLHVACHVACGCMLRAM